MITFFGLEWRAEQRNLRERVFVVVLLGVRMAIQTEKPARKDICGRPFESSDGNPDRETGKKGYLWSSFWEFGWHVEQRNWQERTFVVVLFGLPWANSDRENYEL